MRDAKRAARRQTAVSIANSWVASSALSQRTVSCDMICTDFFCDITCTDSCDVGPAGLMLVGICRAPSPSWKPRSPSCPYPISFLTCVLSDHYTPLGWLPCTVSKQACSLLRVSVSQVPPPPAFPCPTPASSPERLALLKQSCPQAWDGGSVGVQRTEDRGAMLRSGAPSGHPTLPGSPKHRLTQHELCLLHTRGTFTCQLPYPRK